MPGEDLAPDELKNKLEQIQNRLANIEEVALEKELLLQHVTRLLEKQQERNSYSKVKLSFQALWSNLFSRDLLWIFLSKSTTRKVNWRTERVQ